MHKYGLNMKEIPIIFCDPTPNMARSCSVCHFCILNLYHDLTLTLEAKHDAGSLCLPIQGPKIVVSRWIALTIMHYRGREYPYEQVALF